MTSKLIIVCSSARNYGRIDSDAVDEIAKDRQHAYYALKLPVDGDELIAYLVKCPCGEDTVVFQVDENEG